MSRGRGLAFTAIMILVVLVGVEAAAFVIFAIADKEIVSYARLADDRRRVMSEGASLLGEGRRESAGDEIASTRVMAIHPFLGYVLDPNLARKLHPDIDEFGFTRNPEGIVLKRRPDRLLVGVVGGSVAQILAYHSAGLLPQLENSPLLAGRRVMVVTLANGGYKQPQQLMALNYLLALGGELDVLVNIDGVNDVSLAPADNVPHGVHPLFPHEWRGFVGAITEPRAQRLLGKAAYLASVREGLARRADSRPLRYSLTAQLAWRSVDRRLSSSRTAALLELQQMKLGPLPFSATGPRTRYRDEAELYQELASAWKRCSLQLARLAAANGIRYHHFLQANQYFPGSKPMDDSERRVALAPVSPFRTGVEKGYPLLRQRGQELKAEGVAFHDLTMMFAGVAKPVYIDNCCHYNAEGLDRLGHEVTAAILKDLEASPPRD